MFLGGTTYCVMLLEQPIHNWLVKDKTVIACSCVLASLELLACL